MGLVPKYYLLAADTSQVSLISLTWNKNDLLIDYLSSKLSLTCRVNVNHKQSIHIPVYSLCVGIGNILVVFKTN